jgi:hypothetical protein
MKYHSRSNRSNRGRRAPRNHRVWLACAALLLCAHTPWAQKISGQISAEARLFHQKAQLDALGERPGSALLSPEVIYPSATWEPKLAYKWEGPGLDAALQPYLRYDRYDSNRTLFDFKAAKVGIAAGSWYFKAGMDVEFWGVLESRNLVNILNQTDLTEDLLSKRKFGQPMVAADFVGDWGTVDVYALEFFRPREFPGPQGRLRPPLPISDHPSYESENGKRQPDFAARYSKGFGSLDVAVSQFYGTDRDPEMSIAINPLAGPYLAVHYPLLAQSGLELQWTFGNLILKTEDVLRLNGDWEYASAAGGVGLEYNLGARLGMPWDLTWVEEAIYDRREETLILPFTRDVFSGFRLACNDARSTEVTLGSDWDYARGRNELVMGEASTRLSDRSRIFLSWRYLTSLESESPVYTLHKDGYTKLRLELYL